MNLNIGDKVEYDGRLWLVRGFTRASSSEQQVLLEDPQATTKVVLVPLRDVTTERPARHQIHPDSQS